MKWWDKLIITILLILLLIYFCLIITTDFGFPCIINKLTGFYCPTCGISRMFISLLYLDFYQAFRFNPLIFILFFIFLLFMLINIIYYLKKHKFIKIPIYIYVILVIILIVYGVLRNIPGFEYLIPTLVK